MYTQRRQNKYHAVSQEYNGVRYDSKKEVGFAQELDLRVRAKDIKSWDRQKKIELNVLYEKGNPVLTNTPGMELKQQGKQFSHIANYYIDFVIQHNDGSTEYVEIKSPITKTDVWRLKWKMTEAILGNSDNIKLSIVM